MIAAWKGSGGLVKRLLVSTPALRVVQVQEGRPDCEQGTEGDFVE
jgi:hypothetical protein